MGSGSGTWYTINVPSGFNASSTSIYGVDNVGSDNVDLGACRIIDISV